MKTETASITLLQVAEQERRVAEVEHQVAGLDSQDRALTDAITDAALAGRIDDAQRIRAEREEIRAQRQALAEILPALRQKLEERRVPASFSFLCDWHGGPLLKEAQAHEKAYAQCVREAERIETELQRMRAQAEVHRGRVHVLADVSEAIARACGLPTPRVPPPTKQRQPDAPLRHTRIRRALTLDDLLKAAREAVGMMREDEVLGHPDLVRAVEALLSAKPPKTPGEIQDEKRDAVDRPHREELTRVDNWLKSQLSAGPVSYDVLAKAATKARIPIKGRSELGWGQATMQDAAGRVDAYEVVRYVGDEPAARAAAEKWDAHTVYWTLRPTPMGLTVPRERLTNASKMSAMRA